MRPLQKRERFSFAVLHLRHRALARGLVGAITQNLRAVPKTASREMVVGDFHDSLRVDGLPFTAPFGAPTARSARRVPGETWLLPERFESFCQRRPLARLEGRGEADVMQQSV